MDTTLLDMQEYLDTVHIPIRLAVKTKTGWPVVVSLWYLHQGGLLYCATQSSAKIVQHPKHDERCAFEIAEDRPPYCGVRGQATAVIDAELGKDILMKLLYRYLGNIDNNLAVKLLAKIDTEVAIILNPRRIYTWDFSSRMSNLNAAQGLDKVCP